MTKGSDEEISLMHKSGSQMDFCLAPRYFNDCYNPLVENGHQNLTKQDSTHGLLRTRGPTMKQGGELDMRLATLMDD
eukprot:5663986-Pyramimonas_sp.AAC.1